MTERQRPQPRRGRYVQERPPVPPWMKIVFIGLPCALILVLAAIIIGREVTKEAEPPPEPKVVSSESISAEADKLFAEGKALKAQGFKAEEQGDRDRSYELLSRALEKFRTARSKYDSILEAAKIEAGTDDLPRDKYGDYFRKINDIQQHLIDVARSMPTKPSKK